MDLIDILKNKKKKNHLVMSAMKLHDIFLEDYDEKSGLTLPGKDFTDQEGNFYEPVSCKPMISVDQALFIQNKR
ncbi:MAG: hypothetical protein HRT99_03865 [Mycoplasmatales bacterium]|nr:hypothetical protein [Mycoplasmatales bacterium]